MKSFYFYFMASNISKNKESQTNFYIRKKNNNNQDIN